VKKKMNNILEKMKMNNIKEKMKLKSRMKIRLKTKKIGFRMIPF
jgi:hypothetical protein